MDPISELIKAVTENNPQKALPANALDETAGLIPGRTETKVEDLLESPELKAFRKNFATGKVEAELINAALGILKALLVARGILPG